MPLGFNFCTFDFSGQGNSEAEYVTLGKRETKDLAAVIAYLRKTWKVENIGLWGRSMGATTAMMYMK